MTNIHVQGTNDNQNKKYYTVIMCWQSLVLLFREEDQGLMMKTWPVHSMERGLLCACSFRWKLLYSLSERVKAVDVGKLVEIPSEIEVRQAVSNLYKQKEEHPDTFSYIKFPFGMIDYDGLQMLQKYHEYIALTKKVAEEKAWLKQAAQKCEGLGINIDKINQHFKDNVWSTASFNPTTFIRNLVGKRWLTDDVIESVYT